MHPWMYDVNDSCSATRGGTAEKISDFSQAAYKLTRSSCGSVVRESDRRYGGRGFDSYLEI